MMDEGSGPHPTMAQPEAQPLTERRQLRIEVERLRPMAELGRMAATVTHEIRNPLAGISANAELLRESLTDPADQELVDTILGEVHRLGSLVTDLLFYCRERPALVRSLDLAAVARSVCELSRPQAQQAQVALSWAGEGRICGDAELSRQALLNVVRNAVQACGRGGAVRVEVDASCIRVHDTGGGIPEAVRTTLFEPFVTGRTRGLGLGATVAKRCQLRQGGDLQVERTGPEGTVFVLTWGADPV